MKRKNLLILFGIIVTSVIILTFGTIWYLNVTGLEVVQLSPQGSRQMMGYILKTYTDKMIIVDGGTKEDTENLKKYIKSHNNIVDYWFITHLHDDHIGAFLEIAKQENVTIKNLIYAVNNKEWYEVYEPNRATTSDEFFEILEKISANKIEATVNQEFYIDNAKVKILGVNNPEITENSGNNSSMVIKFNIHDKSILFLGDTGVESSEKLLSNNRNNLKSYAVQMAHHGQAGATEEVYKEISPTICLWPTPDWLWNNDIGLGEDSGTYKTKQTREWISRLNVKQNYVAKDGDVTIRIW